MNITLRPEQEDSLREIVATSEFTSIEDAARHFIDERIAERELERATDLTWAKPAIEVGLAAWRRGETLSVNDHKARNAARIASLRR